MARKKSGKEALEELRLLIKDYKAIDRDYNRSHKEARKASEKIFKALKNFPAKERELYQEKLDKLATLVGKEVYVPGTKNIYVHN
jgi:hypothetical protein